MEYIRIFYYVLFNMCNVTCPHYMHSRLNRAVSHAHIVQFPRAISAMSQGYIISLPCLLSAVLQSHIFRFPDLIWTVSKVPYPYHSGTNRYTRQPASPQSKVSLFNIRNITISHIMTFKHNMNNTTSPHYNDSRPISIVPHIIHVIKIPGQ